MGMEDGVHNKLAEDWGFVESDRGRFHVEVLGGWIQGEGREGQEVVLGVMKSSG